MNLIKKFFGANEKPRDMPKVFEGKDIREVWDWRLSKGNPILYCDGPTWVIKIWANDGSGILAETVTDIPTKTGSDAPHDHAAVAQCYQWLYKMRKNFARENFEELKPEVARINAVNKKLSEAFKRDS